MRVYVIGNEDAVLGFSLVGVDGRIVREQADLRHALDQCLSDKSIGLMLVTSDIAELDRVRIDALKVSSLSPLVVEIPGEEAGRGFPSLLDFVQRAVGVRLGGD
ncbi:MAG: V-type ATP synthase subunit F [Anaerolineae bacterium]